MAMVPLSDVVADARRALESGDYPLARAACDHVLTHFPSYADMHRLQGEVLLEQGDAEGARGCFETALAGDPQNVLAILGLGVIAEEGLDLAGAAAAFQRALEVDPSLSQLRDELVRLYSKLYGAGGRLHVSGAGLAAMYARGNQLTLARREFEAVTGRHPERLDLLLALVEVTWRAGDLAAAQALCRRVLDTNPSAVRALYIQADIYQRLGNAAAAASDLQRALAIDPTGDVARVLAAGATDQSVAGMSAPEPTLPAFDPSVVPPPPVTTARVADAVTGPFMDSEWKRISDELAATAMPAVAPATAAGPSDPAGAPPVAPPQHLVTGDLERVSLVTADLGAAAAVAGVALALTGDLLAETSDDTADTAGETVASDAPPVDLTEGWERTTAELLAATPETVSAPGYTDTLREIDELGVKPFAHDTGLLDEQAEVERPTEQPAVTAEAEPVTAAPSTEEPASKPDREEPAPLLEAPLLEAAAIGMALHPLVDSVATAPLPAVAPAALPVAAAPVTPAADPTDGTAEAVATAGLRQLVADWDNIDHELTAALPDTTTGELDDLVAQLGIGDATPFSIEREAPPPGTRSPLGVGGPPATTEFVPGLTQELRMLDAEGITPFDFGDMDVSTAPLPPAAPPPPSAVAPESGDLFDNTWAELESQLNAAVPQTTTLPHGYTAELRHLDDAGLQPFQGTGPLVAPPADDQSAGDAAPAPPDEPPLAIDDLDTLLAVAPALAAATTFAAVAEVDVPEPVAVATPVDMAPFNEPAPPDAPDVAAAWAVGSAGEPPASAVLADVTGMDAPPPDDAAPVAPIAPPPAAAAPAPHLVASAPLLRPRGLGATIALSGSLFERLRERKEVLLASGALTPRQAPAAAMAPAPSASHIAETLVDLEPADASARRQLADALAAEGRPVDAARHYRLLLRTEPALVPDLAPAIQALATSCPHEPAVMRLAGDLYLRQGRYSQAMDIFRRLLTHEAPV
jgi:tetratricopeptide (TPR) repeat protein